MGGAQIFAVLGEPRRKSIQRFEGLNHAFPFVQRVFPSAHLTFSILAYRLIVYHAFVKSDKSRTWNRNLVPAIIACRTLMSGRLGARDGRHPDQVPTVPRHDLILPPPIGETDDRDRF